MLPKDIALLQWQGQQVGLDKANAKQLLAFSPIRKTRAPCSLGQFLADSRGPSWKYKHIASNVIPTQPSMWHTHTHVHGRQTPQMTIATLLVAHHPCQKDSCSTCSELLKAASNGIPLATETFFRLSECGHCHGRCADRETMTKQFELAVH